MKLTDEHREFLRSQVRTDTLLYDFLLAFIKRFNLDPMQAGKLLGEWIKETT